MYRTISSVNNHERWVWRILCIRCWVIVLKMWYGRMIVNGYGRIRSSVVIYRVRLLAPTDRTFRVQAVSSKLSLWCWCKAVVRMENLEVAQRNNLIAILEIIYPDSVRKWQQESIKSQPKNNHVQRYKNEIISKSTPHVIDFLNTPVTLESRSPWFLGRCSRQLRKICAGANVMYSQAERVFIFEHYFASKSFTAVREAFSNAYSDKEVPNKTMNQLVTKFWDTGRVCVSWRRWMTFSASAI
jgi:hypothetical protein